MLRRYCDQAGLNVRDFVSLAGDVLNDVARQLIEGVGPVPTSVENLLITVFKNRFIDEERKEGRHAARAEAAGGPDDKEIDGVQRAACSEASLRAAGGPLWETVPLAAGVERLASMLEEGLTEEERMLLAWVSAHRPQTQIAQWLGVSYPAAKKRLERLRARLSDLAKQYQHSLSGQDRRDVDRFFARFDNVLHDRKLPPPGGKRTAINE
jgi:DNA-directed RNA polymerase specialized sigma24 family protein